MLCDFNWIYKRSAEIIVENKGNCNKVNCKYCPFNRRSELKTSCVIDGFAERIETGRKDKTLYKNAKTYLRVCNRVLNNG